MDVFQQDCHDISVHHETNKTFLPSSNGKNVQVEDDSRLSVAHPGLGALDE